MAGLVGGGLALGDLEAHGLDLILLLFSNSFKRASLDLSDLMADAFSIALTIRTCGYG